MAFIEKFLGKRVEIPEDRRYDSKQGLWLKSDGQEIVFGLSEPVLILAGGINDLDWLVSDGETIEREQTVIFAISGKILYINAPLAGTIRFNSEVRMNPSLVSKEPYGKGWLFRLKYGTDVESVMQDFSSDKEYLEGLKSTEGFKNPEGLKGGVSGICKAVYSGLREQKIQGDKNG
jgi:glycine cleavage system H protein